MTSSTYRPSPHTNTHRVQIILIICHLRIRSAFPRCHLHYQPAAAAAAASEYTGRSRDVEVTSIRMRLLASSYNRYGLSVESGGLDVTQTYLCGRRLRSNNLSLRNLLRNKAPTRPSSEEGKKNLKVMLPEVFWALLCSQLHLLVIYRHWHLLKVKLQWCMSVCVTFDTLLYIPRTVHYVSCDKEVKEGNTSTDAKEENAKR